MIVKGKEFSEATIIAALQKHCNFEEEKKPYIFKAGDVAEGPCKKCRIIVSNGGDKISFDIFGNKVNEGQSNFEFYDYKKIGTLTDFIKENYNGKSTNEKI